MKRELWVAGYPSLVGGADTQLDHNIDLWRGYGVEVHLVPLPGASELMRQFCNQRGCLTHEYHPGIFRDKIVASFCNPTFLKVLPDIMAHGRPRLVVWFNCMTWHVRAELEAHRQGWLDVFGFNSSYQRSHLLPELLTIRPVQELHGYRPFFNLNNAAQQLQFSYRAPDAWFGLGRVSRADPDKFSCDMWRIFDKVCAPRPTKTFILGYSDEVAAKTGPPPATLDWMVWSPGAIPVRQLYERLHVLIHKTGGSRESYGRVVLEAYAAGVPVIVEDDYAFPDLVVQGVTGYRCRSSDEMSYRASELAFDEAKRKNMARAAYEHLAHEIAAPEKCWQPWQELFASA